MTLRSTPLRSSFRPVEASNISGAETRVRFSVAHSVSANSRFTVPNGPLGIIQVQRRAVALRDDDLAHGDSPYLHGKDRPDVIK